MRRNPLGKRFRLGAVEKAYLLGILHGRFQCGAGSGHWNRGRSSKRRGVDKTKRVGLNGPILVVFVAPGLAPNLVVALLLQGIDRRGLRKWQRSRRGGCWGFQYVSKARAFAWGRKGSCGRHFWRALKLFSSFYSAEHCDDLLLFLSASITITGTEKWSTTFSPRSQNAPLCYNFTFFTLTRRIRLDRYSYLNGNVLLIIVFRQTKKKN